MTIRKNRQVDSERKNDLQEEKVEAEANVNEDIAIQESSNVANDNVPKDSDGNIKDTADDDNCDKSLEIIQEKKKKTQICDVENLNVKSSVHEKKADKVGFWEKEIKGLSKNRRADAEPKEKDLCDSSLVPANFVSDLRHNNKQKTEEGKLEDKTQEAKRKITVKQVKAKSSLGKTSKSTKKSELIPESDAQNREEIPDNTFSKTKNFQPKINLESDKDKGQSELESISKSITIPNDKKKKKLKLKKHYES